jgi:O-antigen ligase
MTNLLGKLALAVAAAAVLVAPWLFGAWEFWWFWPVTVCIFASGLLFGLKLVVETCDPVPLAGESRRVKLVTRLQGRSAVFLWFAPFLLYLYVRYLQTDVRLDAERIWLLFLTSFVLTAVFLFGVSRSASRAVCHLILLNVAVLGVYGIANHFITRSHFVLGTPGYPQYYLAGRASGTYFCPDHFAGLMEIAICMSLPILGSRPASRRARALAGLVVAIGLAGIFISKSRGALVSIAAVLVAWIAWGFVEWPARRRRMARLLVLAGSAAVLLILLTAGQSYVKRFYAYFGWTEQAGRMAPPAAGVLDVLRTQDRPQMWAAALRAWKERPWTGIGPGMHPNLWPHYAPSPDGDRISGRWPKYRNNAYLSNAVHNDWLQLFEELGAVGFALFLIPASCVVWRWRRHLRRIAKRNDEDPAGTEPSESFVPVCAGLLAAVALSVHSLGDFNLQIPATTWIFSAILATAWAHVGGRLQRSTETDEEE